MQEFNRAYVEGILNTLDEQNYLFPQFAIRKLNNELKLLGTGGFSSVYEMYNKKRPELSFAMKVIGFQSHKLDLDEFRNTSRIQWILCQESKYIMRMLDTRELTLILDENGLIEEVKNSTQEADSESKEALHLQFILMEKLDELLEKDRFGNVTLLRNELSNEKEVIKFALEVGQGLAIAHTNSCLHRDVKIENIFWDDKEKIYKLGDFGIAKWSEDGNAETIVYTDGYGAPEIERRLHDCYNATADIYSFGITLYLLLNDLKFPGSDGYYSKTEVQYNPDYIFPAPRYASEELTRVIRKMCSFYSYDRYQSINEVLAELAVVLDLERIDDSDYLYELADIATETFKIEEEPKNIENSAEGKEKTRAERKAEKKVIDKLYCEDSAKYFFVITFLLVLLYKGLQPDSLMVKNWMFFILPIATIVEALFQRLKEFHLMFGVALLVFSVLSINSLGLTIPHIILILCVLIGCPVLTLAGSISTGLWIGLELFDKLPFLDYIYKWDVGWLVLIAVFLAVNRYFHMRFFWEKTTYIRAYLGIFIYDKIFLLMTVIGIVLLILQKCDVIVIPDMVGRMHLVRTGLISFVVLCIFAKYDRYDEEDELAKNEEEN